MTEVPMQQHITRQQITQQLAAQQKTTVPKKLNLIQFGYGLLTLVLLSVWFFYRHYVPYSTDNKDWFPVAPSLLLPPTAEIPADLLAAFQSSQASDVSAKQQQAFIDRGDGALLADYFVRLYGIYQKDQRLYAVLGFTDKTASLSLQHLAAADTYIGLHVQQLSPRVVVLAAGEKQITLTLFSPQPKAAAGEKS